MVHPIEDEETSIKTTRGGCRTVRIKVRMSAGQLKELAGRVDLSKGGYNSELGRLILQECLLGKFSAAPVVAAHNFELSKGSMRVGRSLSTICE